MNRRILAGLIICIAFMFGAGESVDDGRLISDIGTVQAAEIIDSGECGESAFWSVDDSWTLTVSGNGKMIFDIAEIPWSGYSALIERVVIEDGIENINNYAFYNFKKLSEVSLPDSVEDIGYGAFEKCVSLKEIEIPEEVKIIKDHTFSFCKCLTSVKLPEHLEMIGMKSFYDCNSLNSIKLPDKIRIIGSQAFYFSENLENIDLPDSIENIGKDAFGRTKWLSESVDENRMLIINNLLADGSLCSGDVVIPENIEEISPYAFASSYWIKSLIIPETINRIPYNILGDIQDVIIYGKKGSEAEKYAKAADLLFFEDSFFNLSDIGSDDISDDFKYQDDRSDRIIDSGSCGENVFWKIDGNMTLTVYGNGKMEDYNEILILNDYSVGFSYCDSPSDAPWYMYHEFIRKLIIEDGVENVGKMSFYNFSSLSEANISDSVKIINNNAFLYCCCLQSVRLSKNLTEINRKAFEKCIYLKSISIPDGVKKLDYDVFSNCKKLKKIDIPESITSIAMGVFDNTIWLDEKRKESPLVIVNGILIDGKTCSGDVVIPDDVHSIAQSAFLGNYDIISVKIPYTVENIGIQIFSSDTAVIIYGIKGSEAEKYAKWNKMIFAEYEFLRGDFDKDGVLSCYDINCLINLILSYDDERIEKYKIVCDLNNDDSVDIADLVCLTNILIGK